MAMTLRGWRVTSAICKPRLAVHIYATGRAAAFSCSPLRAKRKNQSLFGDDFLSSIESKIPPEHYAQVKKYVELSNGFEELRNDEGEDEDEEDGSENDEEDEEDEEEWEYENSDELCKAEEEHELDELIEQSMEDVSVPDRVVHRGRKLKQTFMNIGEEEPWEEEGMLPDDEDDLTTLGHGELEKHREMRNYARLAAWEMPLLFKMAKPFQPPTANMPLRFRYTTYMGEQHPAENKVVLEFCPADLPDLTYVQRDKLKKLVGVRYNPEKDIVKMSCESYATQAQNKRYLGDVIAKLLAEARDPADTMEDIPLCTKHHHFKKMPQFPREWIMTEERRAELEQYRRSQSQNEHKLERQGHVINGVEQVQKALAIIDRCKQPEMVMAGAGRGKVLAVKR